MQFDMLSDKIFRDIAPCPMSALLLWAMFFLIITHGPSSFQGLQALHAV